MQVAMNDIYVEIEREFFDFSFYARIHEEEWSMLGNLLLKGSSYECVTKYTTARTSLSYY